MNKILGSLAILSVVGFYSCASKPSEKEIKQKILLEYICRETAEITTLNIEKTEKTETIFGKPAYKYTVKGVVEWPKGCTEFGTRVEPGRTEEFEKTVFLAENLEGDWQ